MGSRGRVLPACLLTFIILVVVAPVSAGKTRSQVLKELIKNYDKRLPPNFDSDTATVVTVNFYLHSLDTISEITMDFSATLYIRQSWKDERLAFGQISTNFTTLILDGTMADSVWVPDGFFVNVKKGTFHTITVPNKLIRIRQDGMLFYSIRFTLTFSCAMNLQKFPLDTQMCPMIYESYAYPIDTLIFKWAKPGVSIVKNIELPQYELVRIEEHVCENMYEGTGQFPCLEARYILARNKNMYIIQMYLPSVLVVMVSWISFWLNIDAVPARVSLGVITVLTISTHSSGIKATLPRVSYIKAIDVWMAMCMFFVFLALLEFAFVNVLSRRLVKLTLRTLSYNARKKQEVADVEMDMFVENEDIRNQRSRRNSIVKQYTAGKRQAKNLDWWSRKLFPLSFIIFNIIYWVVYLTMETE